MIDPKVKRFNNGSDLLAFARLFARQSISSR